MRIIQGSITQTTQYLQQLHHSALQVSVQKYKLSFKSILRVFFGLDIIFNVQMLTKTQKKIICLREKVVSVNIILGLIGY